MVDIEDIVDMLDGVNTNALTNDLSTVSIMSTTSN